MILCRRRFVTLSFALPPHSPIFATQRTAAAGSRRARTNRTTAQRLTSVGRPSTGTGNLSEQWKHFKQKFDLFIVATTTKEQPRTEAAKAALLQSVAGDEARDVFSEFKFEAQESKEDYETIEGLLARCYIGKRTRDISAALTR
ncbi:hypothetical protein HPB49_010752 [Dermacentor silvarum]|uniref:Uncharacterized protein n=1 Tax=Dermacentor silvarum TaxID=543639 RepID=A0ACB8DZN6_DERSI|nr:hypothetical protein HPB49_010752 [Dermacentor silvarum]